MPNAKQSLPRSYPLLAAMYDEHIVKVILLLNNLNNFFLFKAKSELSLFHLTTIDDFLEFDFDKEKFDNKKSNKENNITSQLPAQRISRRQFSKNNQHNTSKLLEEAKNFIKNFNNSINIFKLFRHQKNYVLDHLNIFQV